jgi:hypothetical protein
VAEVAVVEKVLLQVVLARVVLEAQEQQVWFQSQFGMGN